MRKSSTRAAVVIGGTLAGVTSTVAFGAQSALFPSEQANSALDALVANPSQSAQVNSGSATPSPTNSQRAETKKKNSAPSPTPTKSVEKNKNKNNGNQGGTKPTPAATETTPTQTGPLDGTFAGSNAKALNYGYVQVQITVSGGQLTDIQFLSYPKRDSESVDISNRALPQLRQAALNAQSANISNVSGASWTTRAFKASLNAALAEAGL